MERQTGAIRLTNKTALALRKSARQERTLAHWTMAIVTIVLSVAAVFAGIRWLPAVPMLTGLAVLLDAAIFVRGRSRYLSLTGQAICAEAAARQMRAGKAERDRQTQALRDLMDAKADIQELDQSGKSKKSEKSEVPKTAHSLRRKRPTQTANRDSDPDLEPEESWTAGGETEDDPDLRPPEEEKKPAKSERARTADPDFRAGNDGRRQNPFEQMNEAGQPERFSEERMTEKTIIRPTGRSFEEGKKAASGEYATANTTVIRPVGKEAGREAGKEGGYMPDERATGKTIVRPTIKPVHRDGEENPPVATGKTIEMPRIKKVGKKAAPETDSSWTRGDEGDSTTEHRRRRQAALKVLLPEENADASH